MEKQVINVPKGIRYISEWQNFSLPNYPHILDKQITGCGFTEWCIHNSENVILCSPRKILLENKRDKNKDIVFYLENIYEKPTRIDKDLNTSDKASIKSEDVEIDWAKVKADMEKSVLDYYIQQFNLGLPCKILVTYDSFRLVKEALGDYIGNFRVIIDEFQSIFVDSKFKGNTEIEFLSQLQDIKNLCYVSATPMMDEYLGRLEEFKDLPYYELDWITLDPGRASNPQLEVFDCKSTVQEAIRIVNEYKSGKFEVGICPDSGYMVESKEAVFFVNSVKNICDIIRKAELTLDECNILCAKTPENKTRIRKALGYGRGFRGVNVFGSVPLEGQPHKMFTLCTRTVYLGADFVSPCARSFIFSDANIDSLTVDITLDLPQILGRQRLANNPWRNRAEIYVKTLKEINKLSKEQRDIILQKKMKKTEDILNSYSDTRDEARHSVAENLQYIAENKNYKDDYVSVNVHNGTDLVPVFNRLVKVADERMFDIQQIDYEKRVTVFNAINAESSKSGIDLINAKVEEFKDLKTFPEKMRLVCESGLDPQLQVKFLERVPMKYVRIYLQLGPDRCKAYSYRQSLLEQEILDTANNASIKSIIESEILSRFNIGDRLKKIDIKNILREIYEKYGYTKTPKATDLEEYFKLKRCKITESGEAFEGFLLQAK